MSATVLSGKELATAIRTESAAKAAELTVAGTPPKLAVIVPTAGESSAWYVRSIAKAAEKVGITCDIVALGPDADPGNIRHQLASLCIDESVHGVIVQTPLPDGAKLADLASTIVVQKDIDGANPLSLGRLAAGIPAFAPATAETVVAILDHHEVELTGRHVAVVGRSTVAGTPTAHLLLDKNTTVTVCHSRTKDLAAITSAADVVVAAVGRAGLVTAEHVRPGPWWSTWAPTPPKTAAWSATWMPPPSPRRPQR